MRSSSHHSGAAVAESDSVRTPPFLRLVAAGLLILMMPLAATANGGTIRIGMTASDIPLTSGAPNSGFEGVRFTGMTLYDALVSWDLSQADQPAPLVPQLAESWSVSEEDPRVWTFNLRQGVEFHDGSPFNADAVVFNFDKVFDEASPQFDARQAAQVVARLPAYESIRKVDEYTVEITTKTPDSMLINQLPFMFFSSPAHWEALGRDWGAFEQDPSGTGPFRLSSLEPREQAVLVPNANYWDESRMAQAERIVLVPIPEATTRANALLSGQVDWIENPPADTLPMLESRGFQITSNGYPHLWPWQFSFLEDSPWLDRNVRHAANLAVNREEIQVLLAGNMVPAQGLLLPGDPAFGNPDFTIEYDPEQAMALLAESGFGPDNPVEATILISTSGSGQMQPQEMNELIQQQLSQVGIEVEFEVLVWESLFDNWRQGAEHSGSRGAHATNITFATHDPFAAIIRFLDTNSAPPNSLNWGYYSNSEVDALIADLRETFDAEENLSVYRQLHEAIVEDAPYLFVGHDTGPRAMAPGVAGFVQAQSWFQDLTPVHMAD
ncbi:ABC transporter substrate-binding protein [Natronospirillum operosum]|uniref:ABC transporter substrate-binding protein n=1 Tax=Natronospirillum operosum TaxID=2759953 RepID=A0A4Z0W5G9_9GAMM|nr:ABC transporter substrate-binding protein [Natronospirillum operosum]TGG92117.1 ABC transporter substrate-binding protein [Natronospirillum operosum]